MQYFPVPGFRAAAVIEDGLLNTPIGDIFAESVCAVVRELQPTTHVFHALLHKRMGRRWEITCWGSSMPIVPKLRPKVHSCWFRPGL
jgi:hypothetical protein